MKRFKMKPRYFEGAEESFTEETAPDWLTSCNTKIGSTMDDRWFWNDHVLTLKTGECVFTDFHEITAI